MLCSVSILKAQVLIEPDIGVAELKHLQAADGSDGDDVTQTVHQFKATIPGNTEAYIPLGLYRYGVDHDFSVSMSGANGNSSGSFCLLKHKNGPEVNFEKKHSVQSRYKVMYFNTWEFAEVEAYRGIGIVLKVINTAGTDNVIDVRYEAPMNEHWHYHTPSSEILNNLSDIQPRLHIASGNTYEGYSLPSGVYVDGEKVLTEGSATTFFDGKYLEVPHSGASAIGVNAFAVGYQAQATASDSVAVGFSSAATGMYSIALGKQAFSPGISAVSIGYENQALGSHSTALGMLSSSVGAGATSLGGFSEAIGSFSTATGLSTRAPSGSSFVLGQYNFGVGQQDVWQGDNLHSVLEVGIGADEQNRKNAMTVYQDGSVDVGSKAADGTVPLQVKSDGSVILAEPQGDISMGIYGQ
ncbi:hypothetical protein [Rubritalea tangerina]|uniref:Trimeric autotransporter adhesin YadA-like head domain-containing protein n=1 Tax=Rubritalea tangerina TaxID=430798 RepID=A0ABW4ZCW9_9BACT